MVSAAEQSQSDAEKKAEITGYRKTVESELNTVCHEVLVTCKFVSALFPGPPPSTWAQRMYMYVWWRREGGREGGRYMASFCVYMYICACTCIYMYKCMCDIWKNF